MAAMAQAFGVNANLLRRWVQDADELTGRLRPAALAAPASGSPGAAGAAFVPMQLPARASPDIRIELHHGTTSLSVTWPTCAAVECAACGRRLEFVFFRPA
jgi:hypothetical protein